MRTQKIVDRDLMAALTTVFRSKGYEGTSLNELADVTGLKKASLYHRFPNGKQEMAESVLAYMDKWVEENVFRALSDEETAPETRLKNGLAHIRTLYDGGNQACIFRAFSMQIGLDLFQQTISKGMNDWINSFSELGVALKLSNATAREKATQTFIEIQGSLVVAKGLGDPQIFENSLQNIEKRYLSP